MAGEDAYFNVATLAVKPENVDKVIEFFNRVSKETHEKEPAALIYRWYKVEGKDEFVWIEKFASEKEYREHQNSTHVQELFKEYMPFITDPFVFFPIDNAKSRLLGGFERA